MSRGVIIEHLGEGKYRILQGLAQQSIQEELDKLGDRIAELNVTVPTKKLELLQVNNAVDDKIRDINLLIPDLQNGVEGAQQEITELQSDMIRLQGSATVLNIAVSELIAERLSILKRRAQLEAVPEGRSMDAWCADYSTQLDGEVALIDINDQGGQGVVIHPGHNDGAVYSPVKDGALFPNIAQSAAQIFFNTAILPGVQKWMPRYRVGTITDLALDSCTVELDEALSSAQELPINEVSTLYQVPVKYMDCGSLVFSVGDRVVVRYTQAGPLVVGFESRPKQCGTRLICTPMLSTGVWEATYYGEPFENNDGSQINPPLGTEGGGFSAWIFSTLPAFPHYNFLKGASQDTYGLRNWIGSRSGDVLSWHGPPSRICGLGQEFQSSGMINLYDFDTHPPYGLHVYYKRRLICHLIDVPGIPYREPIVDGAAIVYKGEDNLRYLRVCASNMTDGVYDQWNTTASFYECMIIDFPWFGEDPNVQLPEVLAEFQADYIGRPTQGMYFSESGNQCAMCFARDFYNVSVLRWSESGGFSEEGIRQVGDEPGVKTGTYIFDRTDSATLITTDQSWSGAQQEYEQTIGFEFIGDTETPVKIIHGAVTQTRNRYETRSFEYFDLGNDGPDSLDYYRSTGETFSESESVTLQPMKIAVGNNVIYQADAPTTITRNLSYSDSHTENEFLNRVGSGSEQEESHSFNKYPMVIDARFGVAAMEYRVVTQTSVTQHSGASGYKTTSTDIAVSYRVYRNGSRIINIPAPTRSRSITRNFDHAGTDYLRTSRPIDGDFDADEYTTSSWSPEFGSPGAFDSFFHINSPNTTLATNTRIRQASIAQSNGKLMMAFEWMKRIGDNEYEPVRFTYMDEIANPVGQFMQRDPEDGYMLGKVGLI